MQRFKFAVLMLALFFVSTLPALAQTSNGTIAGVITDPSGAAVTTATVTSKSNDTGDSRTIKTSGVGAYRIESLIPGNYTVTVAAPNFVNTVVNNVRVDASVVTSVNAQLNVGGASESVSVEASAISLKTDSGELSSIIPQTEVQNLPIPNLNPYSLATTLPGVVTVAGANFTNGTSFSVNGTRPRANNFLIEGQDNNDAGIHGQGLQPGNLDAVKEVTVLTNSYAAEFGHGGGSVSNIIYKSGSNQFHGAAWDLHQNSALNALDKNAVLNHNVKSKFRENIFGFDIGGPVKRDKIFFFASYQWDKFRGQASPGTLTIPTANGVATLQSLPQNTQIANYLKAIGSLRGLTNIQNLALGNGRPAVEVGNVKRSGIANATESPEFDAKGDYIITSTDTLSLRYIRTSFAAPFDIGNFPSQLPFFDTQQSGSSHNAGLTETHIFTPTLVNELRASYGRIGFSFLPRADTTSNPLGVGPTISIQGLTGYGAPSGVPQGRFHNTYQLQDAVSWTRSNHSFKFGADIADIRVRDAVPFNSFGTIGYNCLNAAGGGCTNFSGLAQYIDDIGGNNPTVAHTFGNPVVRPRLISQGYYFQDSWKMRPNFTLDYGLRYEYNGAPANVLRFPAMVESDPFNPNYPQVIKQKPDSSNFGPRLGFAYTPKFWDRFFGDNKTVIRAGAGVFYDGIFTNILDNNAAASPNAIAPSVTSRITKTNPRGTPNWTSQFAGLSPIFNPLSTQTSIANHLLDPETFQWNFNIQRDLPAAFTFNAAYVGTRGTHLYAQNNLNPLNPNATTGSGRINTGRGAITIRDNSGDSIYHGLDLSLDRRFSKGLLFRTSYTYSKFLDDVSEIFSSLNLSSSPSVQSPVNRGVDYGPSAFDRRQRLAFVYVYDIPRWNANGAFKPLAYAVNHWQISGTTAFQTGAPVNVETGLDTNGDGTNNDRPNQGDLKAPLATYAFDLGNGTFKDGRTGQIATSNSGFRWIVPFSGPGNVSRNSIFAPGSQLWNFTLTRTIPIHENYEFEFRTEMLNVFNHGNPSTTLLNSTLSSGIPSSGTITFLQYPQTVSGARNIRFWVHFRF